MTVNELFIDAKKKEIFRQKEAKIKSHLILKKTKDSKSIYYFCYFKVLIISYIVIYFNWLLKYNFESKLTGN